MEKNTRSEELDRFLFARAALEEIGDEKSPQILGRVPAPEDRVYFYAVPEEAGVIGGPTTDRLRKVLARRDVPCLTDWSKASATFGLKYTVKSVPVPSDLQEFTTPQAREKFDAWRDLRRRESDAVIGAARMAREGDTLDFLEADPQPITMEQRSPKSISRTELEHGR